MATKPVTFALSEDDTQALQRLADSFAKGDSSEWLRAQIHKADEQMRRDRIAIRRQGMEQLHAEMLEQRGGAVNSDNEHEGTAEPR